MTNVVVSGVTQPTANQKVSPEVLCVHRFYRKIEWGSHAWRLRMFQCPIARWVQMAALGAAILQCA